MCVGVWECECGVVLLWYVDVQSVSQWSRAKLEEAHELSELLTLKSSTHSLTHTHSSLSLTHSLTDSLPVTGS